MNITEKIDRRKNYYAILDCETATLPFAIEYGEDVKKDIAIAKPLIYDIGWKVIDRKGKIYRQKHYLISEIFSVPSVFNTAYYRDKRPIYIEMLKNNEITLVSWDTAMADLESDFAEVESVGAYNSMFDFKKAITFTEKYIRALYSEDYADFERKQRYACNKIAEKSSYNNPKFDKDNFIFRDKKYPMFDLWGLACKYLLNNDDFRKFCADNELYSHSKNYYSTTAETCYRYLTKDTDFVESHTALDDVIIETEIFLTMLGKKFKKPDIGIIYFPFKIIGKIETE